MDQSCEIVVLRALNHILKSLPHHHPAALPVALWMVDHDELFGAVPQPWDGRAVDATIWSALLQLASRQLQRLLMQSGPADRLLAVSRLDIRPTRTESDVLAFLACCDAHDDIAALVDMLSSGTGLSRNEAQALCLGITESELSEALTGRMVHAGLIEDHRASAVLMATLFSPDSRE